MNSRTIHYPVSADIRRFIDDEHRLRLTSRQSPRPLNENDMRDQASGPVKASEILPFSCEQMFSLAADIERYPEFLTWWISARIRSREHNTCHVDQVVGLGPVCLKFESKAVLQPSHRIDVTSTDPRFRKYSLSWLIEEVPTHGCHVSVAAELEFQSGLLQLVVKRMLPGAVGDIIDAFRARAHALYAEAPGRCRVTRRDEESDAH
jgi:coenzyme Q-binding protein COQ10